MRYKLHFDENLNALIVKKTKSKIHSYSKRRTAKRELKVYLESINEFFTLKESDSKSLNTQRNINDFVGFSLSC
jgi:hypothetical protein